MNKVPHNLFMLILDSQVSISSVMAVWQEWIGLIVFDKFNGFGKIGSIEKGLKFEGSYLSQDLKWG